MRVIFINRFFYPDHSATSQLLTDLAFYLAESGTSVTVLASRQIYDDPDRVLSSKDTQRAVYIVRPWSTRFGREKMWGRICDYMTFYLSAAWALLVLAKEKDVLIVKAVAQRFWLVQMLELAFSRRMCCSRAWRVSTYPVFPSASTV